MEIEEAKLETLTDSANTYGSESKRQSSWVNNTKALVLKCQSQAYGDPQIINDIKGANQDNIFMKKKS